MNVVESSIVVPASKLKVIFSAATIVFGVAKVIDPSELLPLAEVEKTVSV